MNRQLHYNIDIKSGITWSHLNQSNRKNIIFNFYLRIKPKTPKMISINYNFIKLYLIRMNENGLVHGSQ